MYDYIKGILTNKTNNPKGFFATVETNDGVGYLLEITARDYYALCALEEKCKIFTVLIHRDDKMSLCGFLKREDRDIFNILTSVSGVGSKMALTLLDEFESSELIGFVIDGNFKELTRAKGVGPKLAQKIILELKDKLMNYKETEPIRINTVTKQDSQAIDDAQMVLISLGYEKEEIKSAMSKAVTSIKENSSAEDILKETLKILSIQ
ncbi:MAG: Holliday junction branch migration protein RuvA [Cyanobacteria bacterium SIG32]|nr:Holliday junction branch migration protein RuvA [Cyanobacteria bacterium SIG32]